MAQETKEEFFKRLDAEGIAKASTAPASIRQIRSQAANENRCRVTREPDQEMETKTTAGRLGGQAAERRLNIARENSGRLRTRNQNMNTTISATTTCSPTSPTGNDILPCWIHDCTTFSTFE